MDQGNISAFGGDASWVFLFGSTAGNTLRADIIAADARTCSRRRHAAANREFWDQVAMLWPHL